MLFVFVRKVCVVQRKHSWQMELPATFGSKHLKSKIIFMKLKICFIQNHLYYHLCNWYTTLIFLQVFVAHSSAYKLLHFVVVMMQRLHEFTWTWMSFCMSFMKVWYSKMRWMSLHELHKWQIRAKKSVVWWITANGNNS